MFKNYKKFNNFDFSNINLISIYILIAYTCLFFSVGENIANIDLNKIFELGFILDLRSIIPYIILLLNTVLIIKLGIRKPFTLHPILLFFYLIAICQFIGLIISERSFMSLFHFLIGSISSITTFTIALNAKIKSLYKQIIFLTIIFFFIIVFIFIFLNPNVAYGGVAINFFGRRVYFLNTNGFSRYLIFIYICIFVNFFSKNNNYKNLYFIILVLISSLIFAYEGRVNIGSLIILNCFIFFKKLDLKKKILLFSVLIIFPILFSNVIKNKKNATLLESLSNFITHRQTIEPYEEFNEEVKKYKEKLKKYIDQDSAIGRIALADLTNSFDKFLVFNVFEKNDVVTIRKENLKKYNEIKKKYKEKLIKYQGSAISRIALADLTNSFDEFLEFINRPEEQQNYKRIKKYFDYVVKSPKNFSTGRTEKWKTIIKHDQNLISFIFGNGPEYDRTILDKNKHFSFGNDSANCILYLYLCGGLLSVIITLIFGFSQMYLFYIFLRKIDKFKDVYILISVKIFLFIAIRSFFENSFGYWSIDQTLFILSGIYWNSELIKKLKITKHNQLLRIYSKNSSKIIGPTY